MGEKPARAFALWPVEADAGRCAPGWCSTQESGKEALNKSESPRQLRTPQRVFQAVDFRCQQR